MNMEVTLLDIKSKFCNFWDNRYVNLKSLRMELLRYNYKEVVQAVLVQQ